LLKQRSFLPNQKLLLPNQKLFQSNTKQFPPNQKQFPPNQKQFPPNQKQFPPNQKQFLSNQKRNCLMHKHYVAIWSSLLLKVISFVKSSKLLKYFREQIPNLFHTKKLIF